MATSHQQPPVYEGPLFFGTGRKSPYSLLFITSLPTMATKAHSNFQNNLTTTAS